MIWLGTKRKEIVFGNKERHLLLVFRCALNHQKKFSAQEPLPRVNYLSGKKVDKFDGKSDFFPFEIREHSLCVLVFKPNAAFCYFIYRVLF